MYVDGLILLNTAYNFFLFYLTGTLAACRPRAVRMMTGAVLGSLCLLLLYFPPGDLLLTGVGKMLTAFFLVVLVFRPNSLKACVFLWLLFLFVALLTGGILFGLNVTLPFTLQGRSAYILSSPHPGFLILAPFAALMILRFSLGFSKNEHFCREMFYEMIIHMNEKKVSLRAFLDTGNRLREPISGLPVLLASYQSLKSLFPAAWGEIWEEEKEKQMKKGGEVIGKSCLAPAFRLIPVQSLESRGGFLWGFKPHKVEILHKGKRIRSMNELYVGIYSDLEAPFESCEAILHPDLIFMAGPFSAKEAQI